MPAPAIFAVHSDRWGIRCTNSTTLLPLKPEDFRGFPPGWSIAQVASFGEKAAGESRHRPSFRPRIRQPARETRAKPAPHGAAHRQGDDSRRTKVASRTGFEPVLPT
jgi:hypothetical protein